MEGVPCLPAACPWDCPSLSKAAISGQCRSQVFGEGCFLSILVSASCVQVAPGTCHSCLLRGWRRGWAAAAVPSAKAGPRSLHLAIQTRPCQSFSRRQSSRRAELRQTAGSCRLSGGQTWRLLRHLCPLESRTPDGPMMGLCAHLVQCRVPCPGTVSTADLRGPVSACLSVQSGGGCLSCVSPLLQIGEERGSFASVQLPTHLPRGDVQAP